MTMRRTHAVSCDGNGLWYAHKVGFPHIPLAGSFSRRRADAEKLAAAMQAIPVQEWRKLRDQAKYRNISGETFN